MKLILFGASGRMGNEVKNLLSQRPEWKLLEEISAGDDAKVSLRPHSDRDIVALDFSSPAGALVAAKWCAANKRPLVSGTTGWTPEEFDSFKSYSRQTAILWAANMSLGVAVLRKAMSALKGVRHFDFHIEEIHHLLKKDSPSGTALALQQDLERTLGKKVPGPSSIRGGDIKGTHRIMAMGQGETLLFEHEAFDRKIFAEGALSAAKWLLGRREGFYSLEDMLETV